LFKTFVDDELLRPQQINIKKKTEHILEKNKKLIKELAMHRFVKMTSTKVNNVRNNVQRFKKILNENDSIQAEIDKGV
jgi:hypothetical protein